MRHDNTAIGYFWRSLRQHRSDVYVGNTVKTVSPYALLEDRIGQGESLFYFRRRAVKGRIETRDLRQIRVEGHRHLDRREIVRLMQGCERHQRLQFGQQFFRYACRPRVTQPAVHDTMAERCETTVAEPLPGPPPDRREHLARRGRRCRTQIWWCDRLAVRAGSAGCRMCPDSIHLPGEHPPLALVEAEFQGRRPGIDYANQRLRSCRVHPNKLLS